MHSDILDADLSLLTMYRYARYAGQSITQSIKYAFTN